MIEQLLEIKTIRAERADSAVQQQEYRVNNALSIRRKSEQSVVDYHQWRKEEEERRFTKAKQKMVVLKELEILRQEIALLREREADLKQRAAEAKKVLEQEAQRLKERKKEAIAAHKTKEKFIQLNEQEIAEQIRQVQYQEELEQEEFRSAIVS
ncbi:YscO family type III secretion system apparatus protein [Vibrio sp. 10N.222.54.F12]|jgi:type III secretion protein O|uniref:YscO family type III secretion system apparatus protein n=2 Tax=Vibrio TaxID=662 RepID=A0ABV4KU98_9VIBR|nr:MULTISPECIES: YscO family type III secretion system apparatus protein [Vibrio]OEF53434.1 type III secretion protein [Vibrio tasmaniensis 1F-267]OEF72355.1 type III secretion protein [Vibrio tasmaniensis 1F-187]OEF73748.1 type III secretion protein [Vibrio tasmaniensis 1F-155]PML15123.1 type III secretion protein [Vibrio tasmaniensis]PML45934.1 type III secretion protein [Vibrio tasmaniensis]